MNYNNEMLNNLTFILLKKKYCIYFLYKIKLN